MKRFFGGIKTGLVAIWVAVISLSSKVLGQHFSDIEFGMQTFYGVAKPTKVGGITVSESSTLIDTIIKIIPRLLVVITFIFGILSLIKIKKISDKTLKKKKIKNTTIIISILVILIVILLLLPRFLKKF